MQIQDQFFRFILERNLFSARNTVSQRLATLMEIRNFGPLENFPADTATTWILLTLQ